MTKTKRHIIIPLLALTGLYIMVLLVALKAQTTIHNKYGKDFNQERIGLSLYPIGNFQDVEKRYWEDFYPDNSFKRWTEILTNTEIATWTTYNNSPRDDKPFHYQKRVLFGTHLCFWQNFYEGETDLFIKPIDSERHIELFVSYYPDNLESSDYFYAYLDTIHKSICGTQFVGDEQDYEDYIAKRNLTKEQVDKLLTEWKIK